LTRSYRNNNPGNLQYGPLAKQWGAVPEKGEGRFAWFASPILGVCAMAHLLAKNYPNLTLEQAMLKYAPPAENDTESYIHFIVDRVGALRETRIKDLDAEQVIRLLGAITDFEGYKA
jgi:hypothetical protein